MSTETVQPTLDCPCCGGAAAVAAEDGLFEERQEILCGCSGVSVAVDDDLEGPVAYIVWDDAEACERCGGKRI